MQSAEPSFRIISILLQFCIEHTEQFQEEANDTWHAWV